MYMRRRKVRIIAHKNKFACDEDDEWTLQEQELGREERAALKKAKEEGTDLGEAVFFPRCALRADGDVFLDDMTPEELSAEIGLPALPSGPGGAEYVDSLLCIGY